MPVEFKNKYSIKRTSNTYVLWMCTLPLMAMVITSVLVGFSGILQYTFPLVSLATGLFLFQKGISLYLPFTYYIWFFSPLLSRIVEYQNGWTNPNFRLIILTPYLVTFISSITYIKCISRQYKSEGLPFFVALISIFYSVLIGVFRGNPISFIIERFLVWSSGIFLGFYIVENWKKYLEIKESIASTFAWSALIMGIYGVVQYSSPIPWDLFWLRSSENLLDCCGWPDPWSIRVWSTLNFPFTFAYSMSASLIVLFSGSGKLALFSTFFGLLSLLLSRVRGAWLGFTISMLFLLTQSRSSQTLRLASIFISIAFGFYMLISLGLFPEDIVSRLQTFSNISTDGSFNARADIYSELASRTLADIFGRGMGGKKIIDAGALDVISTLGWVGAIPFFSSVLLIFYRILGKGSSRLDIFLNSVRTIPVGLFITLPFSNSFLLLPGVLFWSFSGISIAGSIFSSFEKFSSGKVGEPFFDCQDE
jgi:hypothetical protein